MLLSSSYRGCTSPLQNGRVLRCRTPALLYCKPTVGVLYKSLPTSCFTVRDYSTTISTASNSSSIVNFENTTIAYQSVSFFELTRALVVFRLCSAQPLVKNSKMLFEMSNKMLGRRLTNFILKQSIFGHFCAGETDEELMHVVAKLQKYGVRSIFDYAAEDEIKEKETNDIKGEISQLQEDLLSRNIADEGDREESYRRYQYGEGLKQKDKTRATARTYNYDNEVKCDTNCKTFLKCIREAGKRDGGYAAVKVTALANPELLQRLSLVLNETRRLFRSLATSERVQDDDDDETPSNRYMNMKISKASFCSYLKKLGVCNVKDGLADKMFQKIDKNKSGSIEYIEWIDALDPRNESMQSLVGPAIIPPDVLLASKAVKPLPNLSPSEMKQFHSMVSRLNTLASAASEERVRLLIDAEHTFVQPAIDHLVYFLQRSYNKEFPVVYQTYQCYLKDSYGRLSIDLERARKKEYQFACKVVRGAYMYQERERAVELKYKDPIYPNIHKTHNNYNRFINKITEDLTNRHLMIASHNEQSVLYTLDLMKERKISPEDKRIAFAQLLGMCDHVSFMLGNAKYNAFKYVPYGPIHETMPYLIRRAEENSDFLGSSQRDRQLLWAEWRRRLLRR